MSSSLNEPDLNTKLTTDVESYKVIANSLIMTGAFSISLLLSACAGQGANSQTNDNKMVTGQVSSDKAATTRYKSVTSNPAGSYVHGNFDKSAAEIIAFHPATKRSFVVNAQNKKVDVIDLSDIHKPVLVRSLVVSDIGSVVNSVAIQGDTIALAVQANVKTDNGHVVLFDAKTLERIQVIEVGALPDMVTFTHDGQYLLVANEGEPDEEYKVDAEGSISIINP